MRRTPLLLIHLVIILAMSVGTGAHWIVLQSVAWTNMLIDHSRESSLVEAVEKTFDGKHPCSLCVTIETGEKEQQKQQASQPVPDIKAVVSATLTIRTPESVPVEYAVVSAAWAPHFAAPQTPPPRGA